MRESMPSPLGSVRVLGGARATSVIVSVLLAAWAAAEVPVPSERETWYELQTPHFMVVSNSRAGRVAELAGELERMVEALGRLVRPPRVGAQRTLVFLLRSRSDFEALCSPLLGRSCEGLAGAFYVGRLAPVILADASDYDAARLIAHHELTHVLVRRISPSIPLWLDEGLAEFYGTFEMSGDEARVGRPMLQHLETLSQYGMPPLSDLVKTGHDSPNYATERDRPRFYAGAWILTHYLLIGAPQRQGQLSRYLTAVDRGDPADAAFVSAFGGGPEGLEKELLAYSRHSRMPALRFEVGELAIPDFGRPRTLPYEETLTHLATALASTRPKNLANAAEISALARQANPRCAGATALQAWTLAQQGHTSESTTLFEEAVSLEPDRTQTLLLYAEALLDRAAPRGSGVAHALSPVDLTRVRSLLERALENEPDNVRALIALGETYVLASQEDCGAGIARLSRALALAPDETEAAFYLAQLHVRAGYPARAEAVIARHLAGSRDRFVRDQASVLRTQAAIATAGQLIAAGKLDEASALLEGRAASTAEPGLREYLLLELSRARASARARALSNHIAQLDQAAALAACDAELATATDPVLRAQIEALRESIRTAGQAPPGASVPGDATTATTTETDGGTRAALERVRAMNADAILSQKEADRYNEAVALYNKRDYAAALYIADDLAANATNQEVRTAAAAFAARIRARYPNVLPSPPK